MEKSRPNEDDEERNLELFDTCPTWSSLSGYMEYKPTEGIHRLMFRRRLWFVLDDFKKSLLGYRSQEQARTPGQTPVVVVDLQSAGIYLNSREKCQFTVISRGSEHQFATENHESAMIWLLALQSLRNRCSQMTPSQPLASAAAATAASFAESPGNEEAEPTGSVQQSTNFVCTPPRKPTGNSVQLFLPHHPSTPPPVHPIPHTISHPSRLSSFRRFSGTSQRYWYGKYQHQKRIKSQFRHKGISLDTGINFYEQQGLPFHELCFGWEPGDDVFENGAASGSCEIYSNGRMKKAHSDDTHLGDEELVPLNRNSSGTVFAYPRSARIESVDSALEPNNHSDLINQLVELEKQLLTSKCEMAKLLNKETCFKEMLDKRDQTIKGLDQKIKEMEEEQKSKTSIADRVQNQIRELQDQTQFLSREIRHLSQLRHLDYQHSHNQKRQINELKACIETWKDNYVYLLQSSITVPSGDATDQWHLKLFGGDTHRYRVQELLAEARLTNPSLPEYSWLYNQMSHVDQYGFRHVFDSEGLLLHHLCQQLHLHYRTLHPDQEPCLRRWTQILASPVGAPIVATTEMKRLCRRGIPVQFRSDVWKRLVYSRVADLVEETGTHYYTHLVTRSRDSLLASCYRKQIYMDLMRTMPTNINFSSENAEGIRRMNEVLQAFSIHNPEVGYCQGLNFIAAVCLLFLDAKDAFWALVAITEKFFKPCYFDKGLTGAKVDQEVLKYLISQKLPRLHQHLQNFDIELPTVTLNWFLAIFFDVVPFQTMLRVWDCFLLEGPKVLFRFSLAILKSNEDRLLEQQDTIGLLRYLKICTKLLFDAEGLVKTAFEDLKPFPRKQEIVLKQSIEMEILQEKLRKRALKTPFRVNQLQQQFLLDQELQSSPNTLYYDCATACSEGLVWLFLGCQTLAKVSVLDWRDSFTRPVADVKFESRILCAFSVGGMILIATLSKQLIAYSSRKFRRLWCLPLNDVAICISSRQQRNDDWMVYAGLGDGTLAVIEYVQSGRTVNDEPLYVQIGRNPLTAVQLVTANRLWITCGNMIHVLNAVTLDTVTKVQVSSSCQDYVHAMAVGEEGVWLSLNGSSVVELWDKSEFSCRMLYDVTKGHWISHKKEEESVNQRRITALLPVQSTLWIGRGDGTLQIFHISSTFSAKPPSMSNASRGGPTANSELQTRKSSKSNLAISTFNDGGTSQSGHRSPEENSSAQERSNSSIRHIGRKYEDNGSVAAVKGDAESASAAAACLSRDRKRLSRRLCHLRLSEHRRSCSEPLNRALLPGGSRPNDLEIAYETLGDERKGSPGEKHSESERRRCSLRTKTTMTLPRKGSLHDLAYPVTLTPQTVVKISGKPVRCLVQASGSADIKAPVVISCSGFYGDDDAVLMWKKQSDEGDVWSNIPVYEVSGDSKQQRRFSSIDHQNKTDLSMRSETRRRTEIF